MIDLILHELVKLARSHSLPSLLLNHFGLLDDAFLLDAFALLPDPLVTEFLFLARLRVLHESLYAAWHSFLDAQLLVLPLSQTEEIQI